MNKNVETNNCKNNLCENNAKCNGKESDPKRYVCECEKGWYGEYCGESKKLKLKF